MSTDRPTSPHLSPLTDDELRKRRVPLQRKISLKFKEFRGFITENSANISMGGMFIRTDSPQPPGTIFDFEFTLGDGYTLIHGIGEVVWVRDDDDGPDRPAGMGVRFLNLDPESRQLVDRIVLERLRREGGAGLPASPGPEPWEAPPPTDEEPLEEVEPEGAGMDDVDSWNMGEAPAAVSVAVPTPSAPAEPHAFRLFDDPDDSEDALGSELPTELLAVPEATADDPAEIDDDPAGVDDDPWEVTDRENAENAENAENDENDEPEELAGEAPAGDGDRDEDDDWHLSPPLGAPSPPVSPIPSFTAEEPPSADAAAPADSPPAAEAPRPGGGERVPLAYSRSRTGSAPPKKTQGPSRGRLLLAALALVLLALAVFLAVPSSPRDSLFASLGFAGDEDAPPAEETPAERPSQDAQAATDPVDPVDGAETPAEDAAGEGDGDETTPGVLAVADGEGNVRQVEPAEQDEPPPTPRQVAPEPLADPIPASGPFGRLLGITWQESGDRTVVVLQLDGKIEEWNYSTAALSAPPRTLVKLQGAAGRYAGVAAEVADSRVERVRVGYHPGATPGTADDELHVVVDLAGADVRLATTDATGAELRLTFARGPAEE